MKLVIPVCPVSQYRFVFADWCCDTLDLGTHLSRRASIRIVPEPKEVRIRFRLITQPLESCQDAPGPEAEFTKPKPASTPIQVDQPTTTQNVTEAPEDPDTGALEGSAESSSQPTQSRAPNSNSEVFELSIMDPDLTSRLSRSRKSSSSNWHVKEFEIIPYITSKGSEPCDSGYRLDTFTPLTYPAPDQHEIGANRTPSGSPHTLRFFLPHEKFRRDMVFVPHNGKPRVAMSGEEVKIRFPRLFTWAQGRGWWKGIPGIDGSSGDASARNPKLGKL